MLNKIGQHVMSTRFVGDFFTRLCMEIQNNNIIGVGSPSQQDIDKHSRRLSQAFLKFYPCVFKKPNICTLIDASPLTKHDQEVVLSCISGM